MIAIKTDSETVLVNENNVELVEFKRKLSMVCVFHAEDQKPAYIYRNVESMTYVEQNTPVLTEKSENVNADKIEKEIMEAKTEYSKAMYHSLRHCYLELSNTDSDLQIVLSKIVSVNLKDNLDFEVVMDMIQKMKETISKTLKAAEQDMSDANKKYEERMSKLKSE